MFLRHYFWGGRIARLGTRGSPQLKILIFADHFFLLFKASSHHLFSIRQQMLSISAFQAAHCSVLIVLRKQRNVFCFFLRPYTSILRRAWSLGEDISYPLLIHTACSQELKPSPSNQQKVWGGAYVRSCSLKVGDDSNCLSGATRRVKLDRRMNTVHFDMCLIILRPHLLSIHTAIFSFGSFACNLSI